MRKMTMAACLTVSMLAAGSADRGLSLQRTNPTPTYPTPYPPPAGDPISRSRDSENRDPLADRMEQQQAKSRNNDRQKRLMADTEKLLSLATELKEQVDKTDKNTLSVDVIKKADEIEKLAHSVKERMKG